MASFAAVHPTNGSSLDASQPHDGSTPSGGGSGSVPSAGKLDVPGSHCDGVHPAHVAPLLDILTLARSAKVSHLWRVTAVPLALGICLGLTGVILFAGSTLYSARWFVSMQLMFISMPALLLAVPPTHALAVDAISAFAAAISLAFGATSARVPLSIHLNVARLDSCPALVHLTLRIHTTLLQTIIPVGCALAILYGLARRLAHARTTRAQLDALWRYSAIGYFGATLTTAPLLALLLAWVPRAASTSTFTILSVTAVVNAACGMFCTHRRLRMRLHGWLAARGDGVNAAAGIAVLIGRSDPLTAVSEGTRRLRAVPCGLLTAEVFTPEVDAPLPCPSLSQPAALDAIDCFVSHSWHDDPAAKFAALQAWRSEFVTQHRREPLIWLDSCCLTEVGDDLPHLPIFIAACRQLLILAGPTYTTRLWCLIECFVFDQMAPHLGTADEATRAALMQMRLLPGCDVAALGAVDVSRCESALPEDHDRLLAVIESAYGSTDAFNERARALLLRMPRAEWPPEAPATAGPHGGCAGSLEMRPASGGAAPEAFGPPPVSAAADAAASARARAGQRSCAPHARTASALLLALAACTYLAGSVLYSRWAAAPALAECARCEGALDGLCVPGEPGWFFASEAAGRAAAGRAFNYSALGTGGAQPSKNPALTWVAARAACEASGGALAAPADAAEERTLQCILGEHSRGAWVGVPAAGAYAHWVAGNALADGVTCPELSPWGTIASSCHNAIHYVCEQRFPRGTQREYLH